MSGQAVAVGRRVSLCVCVCGGGGGVDIERMGPSSCAPAPRHTVGVGKPPAFVCASGEQGGSGALAPNSQGFADNKMNEL